MEDILAERRPAPAPDTPAAQRQAGSLQRVRRQWRLYLLLLPSLIATLVFYYYPMVSGFYHSFTYWDIKRTVWVGLAQYKRMFGDPVTAAAWRNMAILLLANVGIVLTMPLLGAALVRHVRSQTTQFWWRMLFVLPIVVPGTVIVFIWRWFYGMDGGFNVILRAIGLNELTRWWLGDPRTALGAIILVGFPWIAGLNFLVYLAALQSISADLLDAALVDGAGPIRRFFAIELPLIRGQMMVLVALTFIYHIRSFDAPLIMTNGGPGIAGTLVPGLQMYRAVRDDLDLGYGSAIGSVLFAVTFALVLLRSLVARLEQARTRA
ncbi:MAG: L-arabinose transport system permease protein AraP [Chloroflexi bacterium ADurb.Bin325]|nr:MAG: L-arabinose transport system permease protein AraP [Chloroflexi bacterium ADurb.Bin325]